MGLGRGTEDVGSTAWLDRVEQVCDRFEDEWRDGGRPSVAAFLEGAGSARVRLLQELLKIEFDYRRKGGEYVSVSDYEARFPELAAWVRQLLELTSPEGESCPALTPAATPFLVEPGTRVGRYLVLEEISRGGMGVVYRAREPSIGRQVALKMLRDEDRGKPKATRRFLREALITGGLQHPGIPPVFEVGELPDGSPFLAMKVVEGRTGTTILKAAVNDRPTHVQLLDAFEGVCKVVGFAHNRGVIHRDLKPDNVMVGEFGEIQVLDWGLAKFLGDVDVADTSDVEDLSFVGLVSEDRTLPGTIMGTPAYMPPEQARGEIERVGPAADVFGLGAILCVILTEKPPFVAADPGITLSLAAAGDVAPALARLDASGWDPELITLCKRCLSPDPADRPADALELTMELADARARVDTRLRDAAREREAMKAQAVKNRRKRLLKGVERRRRRSRRRVATGLAGLILMGAVVALTVIADQYRQTAEERNDKIAEQAKRFEAERKARLDTQRLLGQASIDEGVRLLEEGKYGLGLLRLSHALTVAPDDEQIQTTARSLFNRYWLYGHPTHARLARQFDVPGGAEAVAVSADNRLILVAGPEAARIADAATGKEVAVLAGQKGRVKSAWFSPSGDRVVIVAEVPGERIGRWVPDPVAMVPDVWGRVWDVESRKLIAETRLGFLIQDPISRDGRLLAQSSYRDSGAGVRDVANTNGFLFRCLPGRAVYPLAFSPDGRRVVVAAIAVKTTSDAEGRSTSVVRRTVHVLDATTGDKVAVLRWDGSEEEVPEFDFADASSWGSWCFSPDGSRFAVGGRQPRLWDVGTGFLVYPPLSWPEGGNDFHGPIRFSSDGTLVAVGHGSARVAVWDAATGKPVASLEGAATGMQPVAFSPDGRRLLTVGTHGPAQVWDVRNARLLCTIAAKGGAASAAFCPDGRRLVSANGGVVHIWACEASDGTPATDPPPRTREPTSPDGMLYIGPRGLYENANPIRVMRKGDGVVVSTLTGSEGFAHAAFSHDPGDGLRIAAAHEKWVRVWAVKSGAPVTPIITHGGKVQFAAFSPDGEMLVTTSSEGTVRLWDARTGRPLSGALKHEGVTCAEFTNPRRLVTWGKSGEARSWDIGPDERPVKDLVELAQLLSGHRIEDGEEAVGPPDRRQGQERPLTARESIELWGRLGASQPGEFCTDPVRVCTWRKCEICDCMREGNLPAAQFHFWALGADAIIARK